jgi:hypothetical protein
MIYLLAVIGLSPGGSNCVTEERKIRKVAPVLDGNGRTFKIIV